MDVRVRLFGTLRRFSSPGVPGVWVGQLAAHSTLDDLVKVIGATDREVLTATINGSISPMKAVLHDGDEVVLVTPMGGG